jgi:hypothetical protein
MEHLIKNLENETNQFYTMIHRLKKEKDSEEIKIRIRLLENQIKLNKIGVLILKCDDDKISKIYGKKVVELTQESQEITDDLAYMNGINDGLYLKLSNGNKDFINALEIAGYI